MSEAIERLKNRQGGTAQKSSAVLDAIMNPKPAAQGDIIQIPGGKLHTFGGHTFRMRPIDDPYMRSLAESISDNGILEPLLVRPHPTIQGDYEIIAGHTRHYLGSTAGLVTFPCICRSMGDAEAVILMGESNVQRPDWLPSERALTYKAHLEAFRQMRRKGKVEPGSTFEGKTRDLAAQRWGITGKAFELYVKMADLHDGLLRMVDDGRIKVKAGFQLAFITGGNQEYLYKLLAEHPSVKVGTDTASELRYADKNEFSRILGLEGAPHKGKTWSVALPRDLLCDGANRYLADPELQRQLADVVNAFIAAKQKGGTGFHPSR